MQLIDYQAQAVSFVEFINPTYLGWGLKSEAGEIQGVFAKSIRGDEIDFNRALILECGDVLWMLSLMCHYQNLQIKDFYTYRKAVFGRERSADLMFRLSSYISQQFEEGELDAMSISVSLRYLELIAESDINVIAEANILKLTDRKARKLIKGSGDYR